ncbi:retrovirus-related pol polyprotein from transposon TNT 1-94 [Tanacetum coccineum]
MASNSTIVNVSQPHIPIFKGDSYEFWSIKMKTLFKSQDLWEFVESGLPEESSDNARQKENIKKDAKALFFIQQAVDESIFSRIATATSSKHAWDTLKTEYQGSAKVILVKLQSLRKNFENSKSLPPKFDHVVTAIEESKDISTLSFDELMGLLQAREARIIRNVMREDEQAFQTKEEVEPSNQNQYTRGRGRGSYRGRVWYIDSGYFITGDKSKFKLLDETIKSKVHLGNDVHYVPGLSYNLLSVGQLIESGYLVQFDNEKCIVKNKSLNETLACAYMSSSRMFPVDFHIQADVALVCEEMEESNMIIKLDDDKENSAFFVGDPISLEEAMKKKEWIKAMNGELEVVKNNNTWELVDLPVDKYAIGLKWIFKTKFMADGNTQKHKARLVIRNCTQQQGRAYVETFSPTTRFEVIRLIFSLVAQKKWNVFHFDVKSALLNGNCGYMAPSPEGVVSPHNQVGSIPEGNDTLPFTHAGGNPYHPRQDSNLRPCLGGLKGFYDSEMARESSDGKSIMGSYFILGSALVSWSLERQPSVAVSSLDSEYTAAIAIAYQAIWLRKLLYDLAEEQEGATDIFCESNSAIMLAENELYLSRMEHIQMHHIIRELMAEGEVFLESCSTEESEDQLAQIMTKSLLSERFKSLCTLLGVTKLE